MQQFFFQFIILTFVYSSPCFERLPAYHQELNDCSGSLWFYLVAGGERRFEGFAKEREARN
jgi:hypothetical protein